jgi:transposase InsO family protein
MDEEARKKIALFKFSLIAPLLNYTFKEPTAKEYAPATIKGWLLHYKKHGIEGLYPVIRSDSGKSRSLSEEARQYILDAKDFLPGRSAKSIYHELIAKGIISPGRISLSTVQRFIKVHGLRRPDSLIKDRRAFEMEYPGDCWQTDITMGPYLIIDGQKRKTYIIAFIDDASRAIMACLCFFEQNLNAVLSVFKTAVQRRGIPKKLFMDNGKVFRSEQLQFICASLGTIVSHAELYSPQSKGYVKTFVM